MKVLAIDPGYGRCGVAILEKQNGKEQLLFSDCIETSAQDPFLDRLAAVVDACARLIQKHDPHAMAMERLYFSKNHKTAMHVAEVRGALMAKAAEYNIPLFEYTPGQIKLAAAGWGGADKQHVAKMLHALLTINKAIQYDDEYDAIAVGVTYLAHARP
jgi:crossover junction endodeoxyribonuclease RuvC